jgi:hypothetical protein
MCLQFLADVIRFLHKHADRLKPVLEKTLVDFDLVPIEQTPVSLFVLNDNINL